MLVPKTHCVDCSTHGMSGGSAPQKILKSDSLKTQFPHSQADGCVKKVPKIDYLLLNLAKKSVAIGYIFKVDNYCHIQASSQPVFSGKPGMISRVHFVCPVPSISFSEMKEIG